MQKGRSREKNKEVETHPLGDSSEWLFEGCKDPLRPFQQQSGQCLDLYDGRDEPSWGKWKNRDSFV
jgi:hypothetical protein